MESSVVERKELFGAVAHVGSVEFGVEAVAVALLLAQFVGNVNVDAHALLENRSGALTDLHVCVSLKK